MNRLLRRLRARLEGRHHLRRVSPEKARAVDEARRRAELPRLGEKLCIVVVGALAAQLLLGLGTARDAPAWLGLGVLVAAAWGGFLCYLLEERREALASLAGVAGLAALVLVPLAADRVAAAPELASLPLPFVALVLALVWSRALAVEGTVFAALLLVVQLGLRGRLGGADLGALAVAFGAAMAAALASASIKRRSALVRLGVLVGVAQMLLVAALIALDAGLAPAGAGAWQVLRFGLAGLGVGLLVTGLLPAIEALFGVTTEVSLLELGNTHEAPLLRKLLLEAPGTFHHSYVVGLLAEASARAIGANALLARVGALYHDVGKLNKPEYFAENGPEARARHQALAPEMSMLIISAHTRDGVEIGRFHGLPQVVLAFMTEHHGTTCVEYFYHRACELRGEEQVEAARFRYGGPRPQSRESAIVMVADASEAIARQMLDPTRARLAEMVHGVAMQRLLDGQFAECGLTLEDLARVEDACVRVLAAIHHTRPSYPKGRRQPVQPPRAARLAERALGASG